MATKPFLQFNQRLNEIYRKNSSQGHQQQSIPKIYYYRKGRIPTVGSEAQKPGYVCSVRQENKQLKYSNDSRRVEAQKSQLRREVTHLRTQINEQKFFRKIKYLSPKRSTEQVTPKWRVTTEISPEHKTQILPLFLRRQSIYLEKIKCVAQTSAEKDLAEIEARALARSSKQLLSRKVMVDALRGKCFYAMMRDLSIPNSFST